MASSDRELAEFVEKALARGAPREEVARVLAKAGWPADRVRAALAAFADIEFVVPVPRPTPYLSARDAFLYLVLFAALGASAFHFGSLAFFIIDHVFPDPALRVPATWQERGLRWDISFLIVAFPIYLYLAWKTSAEAAASPEKRASRVRKWLTYLALGVAMLCLMGDVVALIFTWLNGALDIRFALKLLTVAVIAGVVFWYYQRTMTLDEAGR